MSRLVLIDTSAWTQALRRHGDVATRERVQRLLQTQSAAWCEMVRLELWSGVRGDDERAALARLDRSLPRVPITEEVWDAAAKYAARGRSVGLTVPAADWVIFACAKQYGLELERADRHYDLLEKI